MDSDSDRTDDTFIRLGKDGCCGYLYFERGHIKVWYAYLLRNLATAQFSNSP